MIQGFLLGRGSKGATLTEIMKATGADEKERNTYKMRLSRMKKDNLIKGLQRGCYVIPEDKIIHETSKQLNLIDEEYDSDSSE